MSTFHYIHVKSLVASTSISNTHCNIGDMSKIPSTQVIGYKYTADERYSPLARSVEYDRD